MTRTSRWIAAACAALAFVIAAGANAATVVYTLRTVGDGKLGSHAFAEALVTIQMKADTATVQSQPGPNGGLVYTNSVGTAIIKVTDGGGRTTTATFNPGEVYVRYDTGSGIAGFGSAISPTYPFALDCADYGYPSDALYSQDCLNGDWAHTLDGNYNSNYHNGTLSALADPNGSQPYYTFSQTLLSLPQNLSQSTLLTGHTHSCATGYSFGPNYDYAGDLFLCNGPAPRGLKTDHGDLYLQDQIGGSDLVGGNGVGNGPNPFGWGGWDTSNTGSLQVEVMSTSYQ
jgi:hypothetical protein